jgi:two-component system, OmpR family, sensor kinase
VAFTDQGVGVILGNDQSDAAQLSDTTLASLAELSPDAGLQTALIPEFGNYRVLVVASEGGNLAIGLPRSVLEQTLSSLLGWELFVTMASLWAAAGAGVLLVIRQLRPLRAVAETAQAATLPLAEGDAEITQRVPPDITGSRTEVARVGTALNLLLDKVEGALQARRRSEEQVRQFVANASHELRTPLTTIKGYAELARSHPGDPKATLLALEKVEVEAGRMATLVEELLQLARLDAGRPLARKAVNLKQLAISCIEDAMVVAPGHLWRVESGEFTDPELVIEGDEQTLRQVLTNLLTNARKYTPPGTKVVVRVAPGEWQVQDNGPGFPPELVPKAFERFSRGDTARTRNDEGGTGLGLSLVAAIVAAHGGLVSLHSEPRNTTFVLTFPLSAAPSPDPG